MTYRDVLESLRSEAESIAMTIEGILAAGPDDDDPAEWEWTEADEEDCEAALEGLVDAFPDNAHVLRAAELAQLNQVAEVLDMAVEGPASLRPLESE